MADPRSADPCHCRASWTTPPAPGPLHFEFCPRYRRTFGGQQEDHNPDDLAAGAQQEDRRRGDPRGITGRGPLARSTRVQVRAEDLEQILADHDRLINLYAFVVECARGEYLDMSDHCRHTAMQLLQEFDR